MPRPFKRLYCDWRSRIFTELKGARLAVWLYHYLRSGKDDCSYPSLYRIAEETGYSETTVKTARGWLRKNGWLSTISKRDSKGMYAIPVEKAVFPEYVIENPESKNPTVDIPVVGKTHRGKTPPWRKSTVKKPDTEADTEKEVDSGLGVKTEKGVENKNAAVDSTGGPATHTPSEKPTGPPPTAPVAGRANLPDGWLPLRAMIEAVFEETGQKVFFPKRYHAGLKRLAVKYGEHEMVNAVRESCSRFPLSPTGTFGPTFKWRLFAAWLLNPEYGRGGILGTILGARELRQREAATNGDRQTAALSERKPVG